jgi:hypothetical protein
VRRDEVAVRQGGDITSVAPEGHSLTNIYYVECKHYKLLALDRFLLTGTGNLAKFWRETCRQARKYKKVPMLVAKQNGLPTIVISRSVRGSFLAGKDFEIAFFDEMVKTEW